jgi:hypothetical protein
VQRVCEFGQTAVGTPRGRVDLGRAFHGEGLVRPFLVELHRKSSKRACCCRLFMPGGWVFSFFSVRCLRSSGPFYCGFPGLIRSMAMASSPPPEREFGEVEQGIRAGEGDAVVGSDSLREAALLEERLERSDGEVFAGRFERLTRQKVARGTVGDGQRVAVTPVAQLELAVEVGAPKPIVQSSRRQDASAAGGRRESGRRRNPCPA